MGKPTPQSPSEPNGPPPSLVVHLSQEQLATCHLAVAFQCRPNNWNMADYVRDRTTAQRALQKIEKGLPVDLRSLDCLSVALALLCRLHSDQTSQNYLKLIGETRQTQDKIKQAMAWAKKANSEAEPLEGKLRRLRGKSTGN